MTKHNTRPGMHSMAGRLLELACTSTPHECTLWPYAVGTRGLPHLSWRGRAMQGVRLIGQLYYGEHPAFKQACGVRRCVNPYHIQPGQRGSDMVAARAARHMTNGVDGS